MAARSVLERIWKKSVFMPDLLALCANAAGGDHPSKGKLTGRKGFSSVTQMEHQQSTGPPVLTNQPCVSHEISDNHIKRFMAMLPPGCRPIVSCKLFRDSSWLIIMIPLWFNITWTYLIITDKCLAICTRTLWGGCKEAVCFEYDSIGGVVFAEEIKTFGNDYSVVINIFGVEEPVAIVTNKSAHQFLARNLPRIQQLHNNSQVLTID